MEKQNIDNETTPQPPVVIWSVTEQPKKMGLVCCYCIPLKVVCFTLGYLTLVTNIFNTLSMAGSLAFLGITSHGFSYLFTKEQDNGENVPVYDEDEQAMLQGLATELGVILLLNLTWLLINIYLLVGLHKKRPGCIRLYVSIAIVRLILMIIKVGYSHVNLVAVPSNFDTLAMINLELSLTAFFIIIYYIYAVHLENEIAKKALAVHAPESPEIPEISVTEHYAYPKYLDKQHLVEKEKF